MVGSRRVFYCAYQEYFLFEENGITYAAQAIDGRNKPIKTITGNPLLCLWATHVTEDGKKEAIVEPSTIKSLVNRGLKYSRELFF